MIREAGLDVPLLDPIQPQAQRFQRREPPAQEIARATFPRYVIQRAKIGQQQMLQRRIFVMPLIGECKRPVEGLLEAAGESRHLQFQSHLYCAPLPKLHFFSITHCSGC